MIRAFYHAFPLLVVCAACGGSGKARTADRAAVSASASASASSATPPPRDVNTAHALVISAASCWLGGLWGDAEGEQGAAARRAGTAKRCGEAARALSGHDDPMKVESLRVIDKTAVDELLAKVDELGRADGLDQATASGLDQLAAAVVAAARETAAARRSASKIRAGIERLRSDKEKLAAREKDALRLSNEETAAVPSLRSSSALEALLKLSSASFTAEAHAIGVMFALGRVSAAHDLPKHLKLYACAPAFAAVFGVPAPPLPEHPAGNLKPGTWLTYVTQVASACGHAVPDTAKTKAEKEQAAWSGTLEGFGDRLAADEAQIKDPVLVEAVKGVVDRLKK